MVLNDILTEAVRRKATDVHILWGSPIRYRYLGELIDFSNTVLTNRDVEELVMGILDAQARKLYRSVGQWDMAYSVKGVGRFRVNIYLANGGYGAVFRYLPNKIIKFSDLGLPMQIYDLTRKRTGLVLVTGATGSGKSTTLASLIDVSNKEYKKNIITLEDPIEYIHKSNSCNVIQRGVGTDVLTFADGVRAALREDPDILLIGEMRDKETIQTALTASETGHLVFSTLHTSGVVQAISRVVNTFPESESKLLRTQLADVLEGVVYQKLMPNATGDGFVCAYELLLIDDTVRELVREYDLNGLSDYLVSEKARELGMLTIDDCINNLYKKGSITHATALSYARTPENIIHL